MAVIREPAVAGQFYPAVAGELRAAVDALLDEAPAADIAAPKALIAPHAGYRYSGTVAARAYAQIRPFRGRYRRVALLGPSHRVALHGVALSGADAFRMPAGDVPVDKAAAALLERHGASPSRAAHAREHSLEVHLPFLQALLEDFTLAPLVVGDAEPDEVAEILDLLWDGPETLIVVSSDLSHYLSYEDAHARDALTSRAIESFDPAPIGYDDACGAAPIRGLLAKAKRRGMHITRLDLRNSGDTAGGTSHVVGYGAWALTEP
ncbi:MAG TPA: AmmeMemoRadiSam system protein B [Woeseiaceae bacterium]|jgi:AmmeMemoRadiSam system protein B|nr:AmmeMemoRadiSam system protein B [Woeseiaceae bacterium]